MADAGSPTPFPHLGHGEENPLLATRHTTATVIGIGESCLTSPSITEDELFRWSCLECGPKNTKLIVKRLMQTAMTRGIKPVNPPP